MTTDDVHAIAEGRVFTGAQALERGLVDHLGGFDTALAAARELAGIAPEARVTLVDFPQSVPWWQQILEKKGEEAAVDEMVATVQRWVSRQADLEPRRRWIAPIIVEVAQRSVAASAIAHDVRYRLDPVNAANPLLPALEVVAV